MKKQDALKRLRINKLDSTTVFIQNKHFNFSYTIADTIVKDEFKGQYKYFGGLQCAYEPGTEDFKNLEKWLIEIAECVLAF